VNIKPEIADRNLFSGDFVIPSQTLRISSGLRLRTASDRSEGSPTFSPNGFSIRDSSGH